MEKRLIIIGASAMGRETAYYAKECIGTNAQWDVVAGFLDSRLSIMDSYEGYPPILSPAEAYQPRQDDVFICAVGDIHGRLKYVELLKSKGARFVSLVHPRAYVGANVRMGEGCIICPGATITADVTLGDHVIINVNASVSHDCTLGEGTTLAPGCTIAGWCKIGNRVDFGTHSAVLPRKRIVEGVVVGAGAIVVKDLMEPGTYIGCPAQRMKSAFISESLSR